MKSINTLVDDIYNLMDGEPDLNEDNVKEFSSALHDMLMRRLVKQDYEPALRMSNFGTPCDRKLWYSINTPEDGEELPAFVRLNFLFGDILEELLLFLAKEAGHTVKGEQDEMELAGVKGHRDAVIDGVLVDVKSANGRSFQKFRFHELEKDDPFGYMDQLNLYLESSKDDPLVKVKGEAAFLAFNKERGFIALDRYKKDSSRDYEKEVEEKKEMLMGDRPPPRGFKDVEDGKSGNRKLGVACSYCAFKDKCWPNLRTFLYSGTPRHLTWVERLPKVEELKR